jgi:hypothetical protein
MLFQKISGVHQGEKIGEHGFFFFECCTFAVYKDNLLLCVISDLWNSLYQQA